MKEQLATKLKSLPKHVTQIIPFCSAFLIISFTKYSPEDVTSNCRNFVIIND